MASTSVEKEVSQKTRETEVTLQPQPAVIVVLIGLPAAGTFTKLLSDQIHSSYHDYKIVKVIYDELIPIELQKKYAENPSETEWKNQRQSITDNVDLLLSGQEVKQGFLKPNKIDRKNFKYVFVIDDNNYYNSMRYQYFQIARKYEIGFCQFHLDVTIEQAKKFNQNRPDLQRVPDSVIDSMASKLEVPLPQKNPWEKFSFRIVLSENVKESIELCLNMIFMAANNPVEALEDNTETREIARAQCNASVIHQADKLLRKKVGQKIKQLKGPNTSKDELKNKAAELNATKDELLEDLRTGFTKIPNEVIKSVTNREQNAIDKLDDVIQNLFEMKIK